MNKKTRVRALWKVELWSLFSFKTSMTLNMLDKLHILYAAYLVFRDQQGEAKSKVNWKIALANSSPAIIPFLLLLLVSSFSLPPPSVWSAYNLEALLFLTSYKSPYIRLDNFALLQAASGHQNKRFQQADAGETRKVCSTRDATQLNFTIYSNICAKKWYHRTGWCS